LAFASGSSALAQIKVPSTTLPYAATYFETAIGGSTNGACVPTSGNTICTFTFAQVPILPSPYGNENAVLTVSRVTCRIVVIGNTSTNGISSLDYAALSKTSNATKVFLLSSSTQPYHLVPTYGTGPFSVFSIDQTTQFYVGPTVSPTITIATSLPVYTPIIPLDLPTCSVSGLIQ